MPKTQDSEIAIAEARSYLVPRTFYFLLEHTDVFTYLSPDHPAYTDSVSQSERYHAEVAVYRLTADGKAVASQVTNESGVTAQRIIDDIDRRYRDAFAVGGKSATNRPIWASSSPYALAVSRTADLGRIVLIVPTKATRSAP